MSVGPIHGGSFGILVVNTSSGLSEKALSVSYRMIEARYPTFFLEDAGLRLALFTASRPRRKRPRR